LQRLKREMDASRAAAAVPTSTTAAVMKASLLKRHPVITAAATAVVTLMLSIAGWLWWQRSHLSPPQPRSTPVPLTAYPGFALQPTFSPDSNEVAFCLNETPEVRGPTCCPHFDIYRKLIGSGEPLRLTYEDLLVQSPAWTRDGKEIFFSTGAYMSERSIRRVPATAPPRSRSEYHPHLETFGEDATTLAISPNGSRLAYSRVSQTINIYKVALSGAAGAVQKPQSIAPSSRTDIEPNFSPDGKKIAFASTRSGSMEIWVCDADGSNPRQMTSMGGSRTGNPKWSPDGNTILFESRPEVMASLYVVSATGGAPRRLTKIPAFWASWSHDGKWIYFMSKGESGSPIFRMPAAGGDAVQLTEGGIYPLESVDGKWAYFINDEAELWKVPAVGGKAIRVPNEWFPMSFAVVEDGVYTIHGDWMGKAAVLFYDFATGKTKVVAQMEKPSFRGIAISPDRRWALLTQIVHMGSDLMLVENFR
jgi:Tol biopolymer transport system component